MPHEWAAPVLTWVNIPAGGDDWPALLSPQQTMMLSLRIAQE
jgi:hypothetical protein